MNIVFNNDLSTNDVPTGNACTENAECGKYQECLAGYCTEKCSEEQLWVMGTNNKDYVCINAPTECTHCTEKQWCKISASDCKGNSQTGQCVDIESKATFEARKTEVPLPQGGTVNVYLGPASSSWWSAKNFCEAHGHKMVSLATLGLKEEECQSGCHDAQGNLLTEEYMDVLKEKFPGWVWTGNIANSCGAHAISAKYSNTTFKDSGLSKHYTYKIVCE